MLNVSLSKQMIIKIILLLFITCIVTARISHAQNSDSARIEYDVPPKFPGGLNNLYTHIDSTVKYPRKAKKERIGGHVFVEFFIKEDGTVDLDSIRAWTIKEIEAIETHEGRLIRPGLITDNPLLVNEAIRVISRSPKWTPAFKDNVPVRCKIVIPIDFNPF